MKEMHLSATDFRVHLKDWLNQVAEGGAPVVVVRHGLRMGVMISEEDYALLLEFKKALKRQQEAPEMDPNDMPVEDLEAAYFATARSEDERTQRWREDAQISLALRKTRAAIDPPS